MDKITFKTVDDYIASFPADVKSKLETIRKTVKKAAPKCEESIAYGMAAFKQDGYLMYVAGYKNHIGLYPRPAEFKKELKKYDGSKGTIKLSLDEPIPTKLIADMVKFQASKNKEKKK